jgi:ubiquitin-conjugating enzyme E2 R
MMMKLLELSTHRKQVASSRIEAEKDKVVVPTTIEEYCLKPKKKPSEPEADILTDFYDDDYADDVEDYDDEADEFNDDNEDSGNGES